jgi:hypothetical protein
VRRKVEKRSKEEEGEGMSTIFVGFVFMSCNRGKSENEEKRETAIMQSTSSYNNCISISSRSQTASGSSGSPVTAIITVIILLFIFSFKCMREKRTHT